MKLSGLFTAAVFIFLFALCMPGWGAEKLPTVTTDEFSPIYVVHGVREEQGGFFALNHEYWELNSAVDKKTGIVVHQLTVMIIYNGGWAFYSRAADDTATPLPVTSLNRQVTSCTGDGACTLIETVAVALTEDYINARASGFRVKVSGQHGDPYVIPVSADQISKQLAAVAQQVSILKGQP